MIDLHHLAQQTAGDSGLQHELLVLFLAQVDELRDRLSQSKPVPAGDLAAHLHRLRGAAVAVGASALAGNLAHVETEIGEPALLFGSSAKLAMVLDDAHWALTGLIAAMESGGLAKAGESR